MSYGKRGELLFKISNQNKSEHRILVYENYIRIRKSNHVVSLALRDIFDIYIQEPIIDTIDSRTTIISFWKHAEPARLHLQDTDFPGLSERVELLLESKWKKFIRDRYQADTIRWFNACCLPFQVSCGRNPELFGGAYKKEKMIPQERKALLADWGFDVNANLLFLLSDLYDGRSVDDYHRSLDVLDSLDQHSRQLLLHIKKTCGERAGLAWDLQRALLLCSLCYLADSMTWEEALDGCLKAGRKLQGLFTSWDEFMDCYLLGCCYYSGENLHEKNSETHRRTEIFQYYRRLKNGPYSLDWQYPLKQEW